MADTTGETPDRLIDWATETELFPETRPQGPIITVAVEPAAPRTASRLHFWRMAGAVVLSSLVGAAMATTVLLVGDGDDTPPTTTFAINVTASADASPSNAAAVAARVIPSIVTVEVSHTDSDDFVADASGSGVVLDATGTIVTNQHVVDGAIAVRVVFSDGRTYEGTVIGEDALTDLAVLRIDTVGLTPISIGSSQAMSIGDAAIAVGSPLGLEGGPSVTVGVLSAFDRTLRTSDDSQLFGLLQTDAPITRGSSGGALVDSAGRLIGITSAIGVSDVGAEGLGFAIPVEMVQRITSDLIASGISLHPFLGITGVTHFTTQADGALAPDGVDITSVVPGTAADVAGLAVGDTILTFDDEPLITMDHLVVRLRYYRVGDTVRLGISRGDEPMGLDVVLLERPEDV
ncbi:MAG: trypsin-like peptidase domain-containing protein [Actinomycetota bacterium]